MRDNHRGLLLHERGLGPHRSPLAGLGRQNIQTLPRDSGEIQEDDEICNNLTLCDSLRSGESSRARKQTRHQRLRRKTLLNIFTAFDDFKLQPSFFHFILELERDIAVRRTICDF